MCMSGVCVCVRERERESAPDGHSHIAKMQFGTVVNLDNPLLHETMALPVSQLHPTPESCEKHPTHFQSVWNLVASD